MNITIEVPAVAHCSVAECSFNTDESCHARAITIGDGDTPNCDTLLRGSADVQDDTILAGVGACKVSDCTHNSDLECTASSIKVGIENNEVRCKTYAMS